MCMLFSMGLWLHLNLLLFYLLFVGQQPQSVPQYSPCGLEGLEGAGSAATTRSSSKSLLFYLTKSLLFYCYIWESHVGVKTCCLREAEKQPADFPFQLETKQESVSLAAPNKRGLETPSPSLFLSLCLLSVFIAAPYCLWRILVNYLLALPPDPRLIFIDKALSFIVRLSHNMCMYR